MSSKLLTTVPFSGFYGTMHEDAIDHEEYARAYVREMSTALEFDNLDSPREYNFATDRIFAKISRGFARTVFDNVDKDDLTKVCEELFTCRDGFISHYSPDWLTWGDVINWDHNQLGALLSAYLDDDYGIEEQIHDTLRGNGYVELPDDE